MPAALAYCFADPGYPKGENLRLRLRCCHRHLNSTRPRHSLLPCLGLMDLQHTSTSKSCPWTSLAKQCLYLCGEKSWARAMHAVEWPKRRRQNVTQSAPWKSEELMRGVREISSVPSAKLVAMAA